MEVIPEVKLNFCFESWSMPYCLDYGSQVSLVQQFEMNILSSGDWRITDPEDLIQNGPVIEILLEAVIESFSQVRFLYLSQSCELQGLQGIFCQMEGQGNELVISRYSLWELGQFDTNEEELGREGKTTDSVNF